MKAFILGVVSRVCSFLRDTLSRDADYPEILRNPAYGVHGFARLPGVVLHYVENGARDRELLLFVHGFPEFWFSWRHQLLHFSRDFWTVAVDMRGFGESEKKSKISDYKIEALVDDVKNLLLHLGRNKCTIVGHDWGGAVVHRFLRLHPDMVNRYVLVNTASAVKLNEAIFANRKQFLKSWYIFLMMMPLLPEYLLSARNFLVFDILFRAFSTDDEIRAYKFTFRNFEQRRGPVNYYRANFAWRTGLRESPDASDVNALRIPGLYIHGSEDAWLTADVAARESFADVHDVQVVLLPGASHFAQMQAPNAVNRLMTSFLELSSVESTPKIQK